MKRSSSTRQREPAIHALIAKLRLKRHKLERLSRALQCLEAECARLEGEIRKHCF